MTRSILAPLLALAAAVTPVRSDAATEEPSFDVVADYGAFELRRYGQRELATVAMPSDHQQPVSGGFRPLANYIFGGNAEGTEIAMTAPVTQQRQPDGSWEVAFTMPSEMTPEDLPSPRDGRVQLSTAEGELVAAVRFSGRVGTSGMDARRDALLERMAAAGLQPGGEAVYCYFDPPWVLGPWRRNEVWIPVQIDQS